MSNQQELIISGVSCANCALKIESALNSMEGVQFASLNYATEKLMIETKLDNDPHEIMENAKAMILNLEPQVTIHNPLEKVEKRPFLTKQNYRVLVGALLFFLALLLPLPEVYSVIIFVVSYWLIGFTVLKTAVNHLIHGKVFDENFLMTIATLGAFAIGEYPEAVAVMLFYQVGEYFQDLAVNRSRKSIADLMAIRPDYANLYVDGQSQRVNPESVQIDDLILIRPGEKVPLDGTIQTGSTTLDLSALTGESLPKSASEKDLVLSGSVNLSDLIIMKVTKVFSESTASKIIELVEHGASKKAPTEQFITRFARYYTPIVVLLAAALALIPPFILGLGSFSVWLHRALVFLVVSCPCALVISIPLSFFGGIGAASKKGILVKGGHYLEALNQVDTLVLDKTGTLTQGGFSVTQVHPVGDMDKNTLLKLAAYGEFHSSHPIGQSIVKACPEILDPQKILSFKESAGRGLKVTLTGVTTDTLLVGNEQWMAQHAISLDPVDHMATLVHVALNGIYAGHLSLEDQIKVDAYETLQGLKALGIKNMILLTGDRQAVAQKVADALGIQTVHAQLLPQDKMTHLEAIMANQNPAFKTAFVGDGINDAPVLALADIGIAMGGIGSDAAIEAADVVLMHDTLAPLLDGFAIAKKTRRVVLQNIGLALGIKGIVLALGAFGIAGMWEAVFADVGVALIAVLNAMRIIRH